MTSYILVDPCTYELPVQCLHCGCAWSTFSWSPKQTQKWQNREIYKFCKNPWLQKQNQMLVSQSKKLYQFLFKNVRVFRFKESYVFSIYSWIASDYTAKYNLVVKKENRHSIALKFSVFEHKRWITKAKNSTNFNEKMLEFFALRWGSNLWILAIQTKRVFQHFPLVSVIQHFVSFCESWCTTLFGWHAQPHYWRSEDVTGYLVDLQYILW